MIRLMATLNRREFMAAGAAAAAPPARRPNVLFIMVDEMRWDALHCAGHPVVETPNLDRLASQGVRFANAYTVSPVCSPSRASAFTGRYAHVHGMTINGTCARRGEIYLPTILRHYGYHTSIVGKLHYEPRRFSFGFDEFVSFRGEGPTPERGLNAHLRRKYGSPAPFPSVPGTCPWPDDPLGRDVGVFRHADEDFETEWLTARSIDYLRSRRDKPEPWFLFTSYLKPHSPSVLPQRWFSKYDPDKIPVPQLPPEAKALRAAARNGKRHVIDDERMLRVMSAIYYGAIAEVDACVGRLLDELDRLGMADNSVVLFTADHGNMLGDRARFFKGVMYEGSTHVPLLWRGVRGAAENRGRVEPKIIENTDLAPALLEAAGLPVPAGMQGRSFLRLARGGDPGWKDHCFSQLRNAMVRTPGYKFIDNSLDLSGTMELYDMRNDPRETRNLAAEPAQRERIEDFKRRLSAWRKDRPTPVRIPGLAEPDYSAIPDSEREEIRRRAPDVVAGTVPE